MSNAGKGYTDYGQPMDIKARLRQIADQNTRYGDTLRPDVRRRIISSALAGVASRQTVPTWALLPKLAAAAAVAVILILPAFKTFKLQGAGPTEIKTAIHDFQVTELNGQVVLTWEDGNQPRRVVKATNREELAHLSEIPGEVVRGERWVDTRPNEAQLVYYLVE